MQENFEQNKAYNENLLDELAFVLHKRSEPTMVFLSMADYKLRAQLIARLENRLTEYTFHTVDLASVAVTSLQGSLLQKLPPHIINSERISYCVNVFGLENSRLSAENGQVFDSGLIGQLNFERENIFRKPNYLTLLWADKAFFTALQRQAPDLWSWAVYFFEFKQEQAYQFIDIPTIPKLGITAPPLHEEYINSLLEKLNTLPLNATDRSRTTQERLSIYKLLAQEYGNYLEYDKAIEYYDKALHLQRIFAKTNPVIYLRDIAMTLNNLANVHQARKELWQAESEYQEALNIYRVLALENKAIHSSDIAMTLMNLANLHSGKNELGQAESEYKEALSIHRRLASENPAVYLPDVAMTLNNLGIFHKFKNELQQAESEYEEALDIYRCLASENPAVYLPDVALTLNNLGILHKVKNEFEQAENEHQEALTIRRHLVSENPVVYLPDLATTLNNLGVLHSNKNELESAESEYKEALAIRRRLAFDNPAVYLPDVATTLNNLAVLHKAKDELEQAEGEYQESLSKRRELASDNPNVYLPDVAMTLTSLAVFYKESKPNKERSVAFAIESLNMLEPFLEKVLYTQQYAQIAVQVLIHWGLSMEEILKEG